MTNLTEKKETIFQKPINFLTKNKHTIMSAFIIGIFVFLKNEMVFATDGTAFARETLTLTLNTLIKIMFIGSGVLSLVFGAFELAVTVLGQNPDAKNKAVLGFGVGLVLIALGVAFSTQVSTMVTFFIS